ncbi:MAG: 16S rRNA (guanine(966)-N(2))-methyltransferase RsmD [Vicinamibacterales bacterium]
MRIVAGMFKGRRLQGPASDDVRPTSDRLRETLFNVLGPSVQGRRALDAFAGTGAVGLEAISRGAVFVTFYERDPRAWRVAEANIVQCGVGDSCEMIRGDFLQSKGKADCDIVFLDPPYDDGGLNVLLRVAGSHATPGGVIVLEHRRSRETPLDEGGLVRTRVLMSGDSGLSFYERAPSTIESAP